MVGLDAAGKTTILYKLKLGEIVTTIPTIGERLILLFLFSSLISYSIISAIFLLLFIWIESVLNCKLGGNEIDL